MPSHDFAPVTTREQFEQALEYTAAQSRKLLIELTATPLPMVSVRLFAHSDDEYKTLETLASGMGRPSKQQPGSGLYVDCTMTLAGETVRKIGIRPPDPERPETGHADFETDDYARFVAINHNPEDSLTRPMPGREDSLFELSSPDYDVLAYVVSKT